MPEAIPEVHADEWRRFFDSKEWIALCAFVAHRKEASYAGLRDRNKDFSDTQYLRGYLDGIDSMVEIAKSRVAKAEGDAKMKRVKQEETANE